MADIDAVIAAIEAGDYDDQLADLIGACRDRSIEASRDLRWRITLAGETWDEDTVTIGEIRFVERTTGTNWSELSPLMSADVATAFIIAHYTQVGGMELKAAWDRAEALNAKEVVDAVTTYQVGEPGKGQAAPAT